MSEEREEVLEQQIDSTFLSDSVRGAAAHHFQLEPNQIVDGRFKVINEVGRGGMGIVYRVEQIALAREMALKTISGENISDITWRRFQQEAKAASLLDHPNLITVHDCGLLEGRHPYFVMDLVDGVTLSDLIKQKGPLQVEEALPLFIQICFGLSYAHDLGIIHRDIKPSNIILVRPHEGSTSYNVKIVDFGIAKLATHETSDTQGLTKTGEIFGSPLYMSPEQCLGVGVDARSDIYSVGCVLFEALAGLPPFLGNTALSTMMKHQSDRPPTLKEATLGKEFPAALEQIVAKLLEKEPGQRYQTLKAVAHDLSLLQQGISSPALTMDSRKVALTTGRKIAVGETAGLCLLSAAIAAGAVFVGMEQQYKEQRKEEQAAAVRAELEAEKMQVLPRLNSAVERAKNDQRQITSIRPGPYGTVWRHFSFKDRMGQIKWSSARYPRVALGEIDVPIRDETRLTIQDPTAVQNDHLFSRFNRDDLTEVCVSRNHGVTDSTFTDIGNLKTLKVVEAAQCYVSDRLIDKLNELPVLQMVDFGNTQVTASGVCHLKRLKEFSCLLLENVKGVRQILEHLKDSPNIVNLAIGSSGLKDEDLQLINSMSAIDTLWLDDNPAITDRGLAFLRGNRTLSQLNIANTGCTARVIDTLLTLPRLRHLTYTKGLLSKADANLLEHRVPPVGIYVVDNSSGWKNRIKEDVMETLESDKTTGRTQTRLLDLR